jgi:hypothetical protein
MTVHCTRNYFFLYFIKYSLHWKIKLQIIIQPEFPLSYASSFGKPTNFILNCLCKVQATLKWYESKLLASSSYSETSIERVKLTCCYYIPDPKKRMRGSFGYLGLLTLLGATVRFAFRLITSQWWDCHYIVWGIMAMV